MNNNYVFNRLLTTLNLHRNHELIEQIFKLGCNQAPITKSLIKAWRLDDTQNRLYRAMPNKSLIAFFDGLQEASKREIIDINADVEI